MAPTRRIRTTAVLVALLATAASLAPVTTVGTAAETRRAVLADGPPFDAVLDGFEDGGRIRFSVAGETRIVQTADLAGWGTRRDAVRGPQVLLTDGSLLIADVLRLDEEHLTLLSSLWGEPQVPIETVRGILLVPPGRAEDRDRLVRRIRSARDSVDRVLLTNGDELTGTLTELDERRVALEFDGAEPREIELQHVLAIVFNPALLPETPPHPVRLLVGLDGGSLLAAAEVVSRQGQLHLKTASGVLLVADPDEDVPAQIRSLRSLDGKCIYVSDLEPADYKHIPYLDLAWPFGTDRNLADGQLRVGSAVYSKGLAMHSTSRLVYQLGGEFARFQADLALDRTAGTGGSVVYRVFADRESGRLEPLYKSPIVRGGEDPIPVTVDVTGADRLVLIVDFADRADVRDHANWLNARLVR